MTVIELDDSDTAQESFQTLALGLLSLPAFGAVLVWSGVAPFSKYALEDFPTLGYIALRPVIAAFTVFLVLRLRHLPVWVERSDWTRFAVAGIGCIGVSQLLFIGGLARTSVAHLIILASTSPLVAALLRWGFRGQQPDRRSALALLIGFAGVVIVVGVAGETEGTSILGDLMGLGAAATWVGATVLPQPLVKKYGVPRATGWLIVASMALLVPVGLSSIRVALSAPPPALAWVSLVYTALGMLVGNTLWQKAVQEIGPTRTLVYLYLEPVLALMLAALFLGERLTPLQALGGLLALLGVALVRKE
jgi:drug/metabolite transporter (DMT)-like permease